MEFRIIVSAIIRKDNKILLVREAKKKARNMLNLPGGHLEENESLVQAVIRETKEETGYDIDVTGIQRIYNYVNHKGKHVLHICFNASIAGGKISFDTKEILDVVWFPLKDLDKISDVELRRSGFMRNVFEDLTRDAYPLDIINDSF